MATGDFDKFYPDHPWAGITEKERRWYDPLLRDVYRKFNIFGQFTTFKQNLGAVNAKTMQISSLYDIHANNNPLGLRDLYMPASHVDSRWLEITFNRYGGKTAYHKYDEIITYWQTPGARASVLRAIVNDKLGRHMSDVMDLLSRNALLSAPYRRFMGDAGTKFAGISAQDKMTVDMLSEVHLGMSNRDVPYASNPNGNFGNIICITSPGVLHDLRHNQIAEKWMWPIAYANATRLLNEEFGSFMNVRFVKSSKAQLLNCGTLTCQDPISAPISAGDGAPNTKVDGVYQVGQPGATHYIQLANTADMSLYAEEDIVTIHIQRTSANGVTNGVDHTDGLLQNRRIAPGGINTVDKRLSFEEPIMSDFTTDLGAGVYGYVSKGQHIHASIFIGGDDGVVMGVGQPPRLHTPPPVDDFDSIFRFTWEAFMGWSIYNPKVLEVVYSAGSFRNVGPMLAG